METIGAGLTRVDLGAVEIALPYRADLTQQHGFIHAGIVATILDSACGYAAFSLMPADVAVLTVEYKINLLRPARGGAPSPSAGPGGGPRLPGRRRGGVQPGAA